MKCLKDYPDEPAIDILESRVLDLEAHVSTLIRIADMYLQGHPDAKSIS